MLKVLPRRLVFRPEGVKIDFLIFGTWIEEKVIYNVIY